MIVFLILLVVTQVLQSLILYDALECLRALANKEWPARLVMADRDYL